MLHMVVFDFDGVITDSEMGHFTTINEVLSEQGISIDWQQYCDRYLTYDDHESFAQILRDFSREIVPEKVQELVARKRARFEKYQRNHQVIFPGVRELLADLQQNGIICAICSGSPRNEIEFFLKQTDLGRYFSFIISVDDVKVGKPDPEGYRLCVWQTNRLLGGQAMITPRQCVAIEDSIGGITAAKGAGLCCLAVTNSYSAARLQEADKVVEDLRGVDTAFLRQLLIKN